MPEGPQGKDFVIVGCEIFISSGLKDLSSFNICRRLAECPHVPAAAPY